MPRRYPIWPKRWKTPTGIQRKGIVLATMMRLKQICNHPSQWLNDSVWSEEDSGKWARLREIADGRGSAAGEDTGFHAVSRDDSAAGGVSGRGFRSARSGAPWQHRGEAAARSWFRHSRTTRRYRSSSCR